MDALLTILGIIIIPGIVIASYITIAEKIDKYRAKSKLEQDLPDLYQTLYGVPSRFKDKKSTIKSISKSTSKSIDKQYIHTNVPNKYNLKKHISDKETNETKSEPDVDINQKLKYMKSDEWKQKRLLVLARDNHKCVICGSDSNLEVHHTSYKTLYNEDLNDLVTLCRYHHHLQHEYYGINNIHNKTLLPLIKD